jgi:hypothetical protein
LDIKKIGYMAGAVMTIFGTTFLPTIVADASAVRNETMRKVALSDQSPFEYRQTKSTSQAVKFKEKVEALQNNTVLKYHVTEIEARGDESNQPFKIRIYKNGSVYKTIDVDSGTASGSMNVNQGTYTIEVIGSYPGDYQGGLTIE